MTTSSAVTEWDQLPLTLRKDEVAAVLGVGPRSAQRLLARLLNQGEAIRIGKAMAISRERFRELLEAGELPSGGSGSGALSSLDPDSPRDTEVSS